MKYGFCLSLLLFAISAPVHAERMTFDHRLYPALKAALDSGRPEIMDYNDRNPAYVTDRIAVQGRSAQEWTEALDIIVRRTGKGMTTAQEWLDEIKRQSSKTCSSQFTIINEDAVSVTFLQQSGGCAIKSGLFRILSGKGSLFLVGALNKQDMSADTKQQWLALLQSAHVVN